MQGKSTLTIALVLLIAFGGYMGFQQVQKHRALKSLAIDAMLECRENLLFLNKCESIIRESGNETMALMQAQGEFKKQLKSRAINGLIKAGISGKKKEAVTRVSDEIDSYNAALAYAFYAGTGASIAYPDSAPGTGEMIKELLALEQALEK